MAKQIDQPPSMVAKSRYNWDEWMNGEWWELEQGVDFETTHNIRAAAYHAAFKRRCVVVVRENKSNHPGKLWLKATRTQEPSA